MKQDYFFNCLPFVLDEILFVNSDSLNLLVCVTSDL